mgnify:CR=1 FL=1
MKEFKGTKGKWKFRPAISKGCFYVETVDSRRDSFIGEVGGGLQSNMAIKANAQLVAAAPEMLEQLQKSIGFIKDAIKWYEMIGSVHKEFIKEDKEFLHEVEQSINKALGINKK